MRFPAAAAALALAAAACASRKPAQTAHKPGEGLIEVEDSLHGVKFELPPSEEGWQIAREGSAHVAGPVQVEVASFPLPKDASPAACRDAAR